MHSTTGNCRSCHQSLDPVGFGLEAYDMAGRFRATDDGLPQCPIDGEGMVTGLPAGDIAFNGPDGLSTALFVLGPARGRELLASYRGAGALFVTTGDASNRVVALDWSGVRK